MNKGLIEIKGLCFSYPSGHNCLKNLSLSLLRGERLAILGANGSGKSTLLRLLMGLIKPDQGEIHIFGKERKEEKDFGEVRKRIGFLFQDSDDQLFSPTVLEDIAFGPLNLGKPPKKAVETALGILDTLNLKGFANKITHELSGGEKRLVALGTILAMEPDILLLDEPTNGLDPSAKERVIEILSNLKKSMIIVSHDQNFYQSLASRLCHLDQGTFLQDRCNTKKKLT